MIIFHSYVKLPEGMWLLIQGWPLIMNVPSKCCETPSARLVRWWTRILSPRPGSGGLIYGTPPEHHQNTTRTYPKWNMYCWADPIIFLDRNRPRTQNETISKKESLASWDFEWFFMIFRVGYLRSFNVFGWWGWVAEISWRILGHLSVQTGLHSNWKLFFCEQGDVP